jgi:hypothetical protein
MINVTPGKMTNHISLEFQETIFKIQNTKNHLKSLEIYFILF